MVGTWKLGAREGAWLKPRAIIDGDQGSVVKARRVAVGMLHAVDVQGRTACTGEQLEVFDGRWPPGMADEWCDECIARTTNKLSDVPDPKDWTPAQKAKLRAVVKSTD
jgi:hypothetical protein